ncbi:MAG TPA: outer membrane protein assembly factor BamE [Chthoniobacterales bacterium]|nr:outer membrane protein assembly factor BamE [Chthoniobacterales bacterium]
MNMRLSPIRFALLGVIISCAVFVSGCDHNPFTGSKLTLDNYNKITTGMSKSQVEQILGSPTKVETKDMIIYKKTTYRYENGEKFAMITFKNDEVDGKDTNLSANP